jgi:hypothetical protein
MTTTDLLPDGVAEKIHRDYQIPMVNIKKAAAVKDYLNKINEAGNQRNSQKALEDLERMNERGVSFDIEADFENWSIIQTVICDFYRREALLAVLKRSIEEGMTKKNDNQVAKSFHALRSHLFYLEAIELYPSLLKFARENDALEVIEDLEDWTNEEESFPAINPIGEKIFLAKVDIFLNQRNLGELIRLFDRFNPHHHEHRVSVGAILRATNIILSETRETELAKMVNLTVNLNHTGQEETLVVLALLELLSRHGKR